MKTFQLRIKMGNNAVVDAAEIKFGVMRCIHNLENEILDKIWEKAIYDENGNRIGSAWVSDEY